MRQMSRRAAIGVLAAGGGLLGLGLFGGYMLRDLLGSTDGSTQTASNTPKPVGNGPMMGNVTAAEMTAYMELFHRHGELHRRVEIVPGGVRTVTEADASDLVEQLQAHVASMYVHLNSGIEVTCMSNSLPTLFRNFQRYSRVLTKTSKGVAVVETSDDPRIVSAIRSHAVEVTGFVDNGMPSMMNGMTGGGGMMGGA